MKLFFIVKEWHYPNSSGAAPMGAVYFDDEDSAKDAAYGYCEAERTGGFLSECGDAHPVNECAPDEDDPFWAFVIYSKNGLDPWWCAYRVVCVESISNVRA